MDAHSLTTPLFSSRFACSNSKTQRKWRVCMMVDYLIELKRKKTSHNSQDVASLFTSLKLRSKKCLLDKCGLCLHNCEQKQTDALSLHEVGQDHRRGWVPMRFNKWQLTFASGSSGCGFVGEWGKKSSRWRATSDTQGEWHWSLGGEQHFLFILKVHNLKGDCTILTLIKKF